MDLHHAAGFCHWCCQAGAVMWQDERGCLMCADCRAELVRDHGLVVWRRRFSEAATSFCLITAGAILLWCWLAERMGWR